ncbi:hypothetical protein BLNAU_18219 [Blattamonas nauphoetae]|uniref:PB1 domain-containing protein n=1 Tax=Blattamonas nauphoetae TaxID=2049346 RepID=A0ABQ9X999_9EUKA|nr:hypothetical protein BLNAU_18219 [Blattamonas nauphoetae]
MNTSQNHVVKITFSPTGDTRRVQFTEAPTFEELAARISSMFDYCSMSTYRLTYLDDEGDAITMASDEDVYLAFVMQQPGKFLRITKISPDSSGYLGDATSDADRHALITKTRMNTNRNTPGLLVRGGCRWEWDGMKM